MLILVQSSDQHLFARKHPVNKWNNLILLVIVTLYTVNQFLIGVDGATTQSRKSTQILEQQQTGKDQHEKRMYPEFAQAGTKPGLEIWRVEDFKPVPVKQSDYGKFHTGDSYLILKTNQNNKDKKLSWDIHYWLGKETTQDESGAAAILATQLDDHLGGGPVQHREVEHYESNQFSSYFPNGVRYLQGGVKSGFHHVDPNAFEKRFYQVKGKRKVRARQIEPNVSTMNKGDCFILDMGKDIYVYEGEKATRVEKLKANTVAKQIRDQDHAGRGTIHTIDATSTPEEFDKFFAALGSGNRNSVRDVTSADDDVQFDNKDEGIALYRISDASGSIKYDKINQKPLKQEYLDSNDCFLLDTGNACVYVWIGKKCTEREKESAMSKGETFLKEKNYPKWTSLKRIVENSEPVAFKQYFQTWQDRGETHSRILRSVSSDDEIDNRIREKLQKKTGKANTFMPDNGNGPVEVYRIVDSDLKPIDKEYQGIFSSTYCYIVKYHIQSSNKYVLYIWQGSECNENDLNVANKLALKLSNEMNNRAMRIHVDQDHETKHFLEIFKGRMVLLLGTADTHDLQSSNTYNKNGVRLFNVRGTTAENVRASQVPVTAKSLDSDDVFILETPMKTFIWYGKNSNELEQKMSNDVVTRLSRTSEINVLAEGQETDEFWSLLGGQQPYNNNGVPTIQEEPYLLHFSINKAGKIKLTESRYFSQASLVEDDISILVTNDEMYIWIGNEASDEEKQEIYRVLKLHFKKFPNYRRPAVLTIHQSDEPESFIKYFPKWDPNYWEHNNDFAENLIEN